MTLEVMPLAISVTHLNENLSNEMWRACDILRRDNNVGGVMAYTEHLAWLMFLKFLDEEEKKRAEEAAFAKESYTPVLQGDLAWDAWASPAALEKWDAQKGELVAFVRGRLLPGLAGLSGSPLAQTIAKLFSDETVGDQTVVSAPFRMPQTTPARAAITPCRPMPNSGRISSAA